MGNRLKMPKKMLMAMRMYRNWPIPAWTASVAVWHHADDGQRTGCRWPSAWLAALALVTWWNRWVDPVRREEVADPGDRCPGEAGRARPGRGRRRGAADGLYRRAEAHPDDPEGGVPGGRRPRPRGRRPAVGRRHGEGLVRPSRSTTTVTRLARDGRGWPTSGRRVAADGFAVDRDDDVAGPEAGHRRPGRAGPPRVETPGPGPGWRLGVPTKASRAHSRTKAIRKCMAEPATATISRVWNGLLAVGAGLVGRVDLLEVGHPGDLHVAPRAGAP